MRKIILWLFILLITSNFTYSLNEDKIYIEKTQDNYWVCSIFETYRIYPIWNYFIEKNDTLSYKEISWDLSNLTWSNIEYKDKLNLLRLDQNNRYSLYLDSVKKLNWNILSYKIPKTWIYCLAPIIPEWIIKFSNAKNEYLWDNKTVYSLTSEQIITNIWTSISDWYEYDINISSWLHLVWDNVRKTINEDNIKTYKIKAKDWKITVNFKIDSTLNKWWFTIYNKYVNDLPTSQWWVTFDVKSNKTEVWKPKNLTIINNKIYWDAPDDRQVSWYILYLKKSWEKEFKDFEDKDLKSPKLFVWELYKTWSYTETIDFKEWDDYDITIKAYDIFWNLSDYSNIIKFSYSLDCKQIENCRWKYYTPFMDSTDKTNTNIINNSPNISNLDTKEQSDFIKNYIEKYNKTPINIESQTYKWVNLKTWELKIKKNVDFSIPFSLYYNSNPIINSAMWLGWNNNYESFWYYYELTWEFSVILPDGNANIFSLDNNWQYNPQYNNGLTAKIDDTNPDLLIVTDFIWNNYYFNKNSKKIVKIDYKDYGEVNIYYNYNWISKIIWKWNALFFNYNANNKLVSIWDIYNNFLAIDEDDNWLLKSYSFNKDNILIEYNDTNLLRNIDDVSYSYNENKVQNIQDDNFYEIDYENNILRKKDSWKDTKYSEVKITLNNFWNINKISEWTGTLDYKYSANWILQKIGNNNIIMTYSERNFKYINTSIFSVINNKFIKNKSENIAYILWQDNRIYIFDKNNIYLLGKNGIRQNLNIKNLDSIWSIFVWNKWDIYITDSWLIKKYSNWKLTIIAWNLSKKQTQFTNNSDANNVFLENPYHIAVDENKDIIYFTEKFNKWLKTLENNKISFDKNYINIYINWLSFIDGKVAVSSQDSDTESVDITNQTIFSKSYENSLNKLIIKINNLSNQDKAKIKLKLDNYSQNISKMQDGFYKDRIMYLVEELRNGIR